MTNENAQQRVDWPERPWIMAAIGAVAGLLFYLLVDGPGYDLPTTMVLVRQAAAAGLMVATLSFLLTAERVRWTWSLALALGWGTVIGLIGYETGAYDRGGEIAGFPFLSGLLAVGIAAPLFQTVRDEGRRALPYEKVHRYAWTDGIIGGASLAFTGLTFLVAFLLAALFDAIGITLLEDLLDEGSFGWMLAGAAFGAASAVLRERDPLLGTLQRLVMLVFSVLAPVLAAALAVYLVALPVTGFSGLWKSGVPETPLLLSAAGLAFVFLNAVIGDSPDDRRPERLWRATELVLLVAILPLATLALVSMSMRVGQYGWTPERLWGVIASVVSMAFGAANWWALARGRGRFDELVRTWQKRLAVAVCALALFLALPIVDFGSISTRSQLARLELGKVDAERLDWAALAFDFGPAGRRALEQVKARGGRAGALAGEALATTNRWEASDSGERLARQDQARRTVRILSPDVAWNDDLARRVISSGACGSAEAKCALLRLDANRLLLAEQYRDGPVSTRIVRLDTRLGERHGMVETAAEPAPRAPQAQVDLDGGRAEVRTVQRRQLFVDGKPVGEVFE